MHRFFAGISEYVFQTQLGVVDPPLVDYVTQMLTRFLRLDSIHKVRKLNGRPAEQVAEMLAEANMRIGTAKRDVHRHVGDFTLFWTGLYPESLRYMQSPDKKDHFVDYCAHGKRAYMLASAMDADEETDVSGDILERLSHQFEMCAYGLREIRREWERREGNDSSDSLLIW